MASQVGMTIRTSKANDRIDAALATLAAGSDTPDRPDRARDPLLDGVLRLEWIADTLEALATEPEPKQKGGDPAISEASPDVTVDKDTARKSTRAKGR